MRKSPDIAIRTCKKCGKEYKPTGNTQQYCEKCSHVAAKEAKLKWNIKRNPGYSPRCERKPKEPCCICGATFSSSFDGKPYCNKHYQSMYRYGHPNGQPRKRGNEYDVSGSSVRMVTRKGCYFWIDRYDLEKILLYTWCKDYRGYFVANVDGRTIPIHQYLLNVPKGMCVDHIDGDRSNNRRSNLRICDAKGNARNIRVQKNSSTGYTGISKTPSGRYRARITVDRKEIRLGHYSNLEDAVKVRKEAEKKYFGEFAPSICRTEQMSDTDNQRRVK